MITSIHTDADGSTVEEVREHPNGPVISRTVTSNSGDVTNVANGTVGIQSAGGVNNRVVRW